MYTLIIVLLIIVAILTCGIVLIQESKGGGLASGFSSSNQVMGVRKTTDFLEKTTWTLAAIMVVLCVASAAFAKDNKKDSSVVNPVTQQAPALPQQNTVNPQTDANQQTAQPAKNAQKPAEQAQQDENQPVDAAQAEKPADNTPEAEK